MRKKAITASLIVTVLIAPACTWARDDIVRGNIALLDKCPGDTLEADQETEALGALAAIFTPIFTQMVQHGIAQIGSGLTEAAEEANVDVVHHGSYFYEYFEGSSEPSKSFKAKFNCILFASKGTEESGITLSELVKGYKAAQWEGLPDAKRYSDIKIEAEEDTGELEDRLKKWGYKEDHLPGIVAVFDLQMSSQRTEARIIPRFIAMDHSIREAKVDKKTRTMTFEFTFSHPGADAPFANSILKIDSLSVGEPFIRTIDPGKSPELSSTWFSLPQLNSDVVTKLELVKERQAAQKSAESLGRIAAQAAYLRGSTLVRNYVTCQETGKSEVKCEVKFPNKDTAKLLWERAAAQLKAEKSKEEEEQDSDVISRHELESEFFRQSYTRAEHKGAISDNSFKGGDLARAFDLQIKLKEFRERPVAKFFGKVLSDEATQEAITSEVVSRLDPATKAAAEKVAASEHRKKMEAYETAMIAAETSIANFEVASENEKAIKKIDMEAKKRAANRLAENLGILLPYPESGTWL